MTTSAELLTNLSKFALKTLRADICWPTPRVAGPSFTVQNIVHMVPFVPALQWDAAAVALVWRSAFMSSVV